MTLDTLTIGAGALVALLPFLGFPVSVNKVIFFLAGIFVIGLGIAARRRRGAEETLMRKNSGTFAESSPTRASFARHEESEMGTE